MNGRHGVVRLPADLRVALVHEWIAQWGGAESVLESLVRVFDRAPIHTLLWNPDAKAREKFRDLDIQTTWLQRIPGGRSKHRMLLPLMPAAFEKLDLPEVDLVFSSSHAFAKGVRVPPGTLHICYCHTPPRYLWDLSRFYNPGVGGALRLPLIRRLRERDRLAAQRVDHFLASSRHVAGRIRRNYGREARVIYPPVDVDRFRSIGDGASEHDGALGSRPPLRGGTGVARAGEADPAAGSYYLTGGRLVAYKRIEIAIEAANLAGFRLKVFGGGQERDRLEALAGPTVEFLGRVPDDELVKLMAQARAVLQPGEEDFGIIAVEAQAAGRPVIAWNRGGARETVIDGQTGVLYDDASARGLLEGLDRLEAGTWWPHVAGRNAERFSRERFEEEILEEVFRVLKGRTNGRPRRVLAWYTENGSANGAGASRVRPATRTLADASSNVTPAEHDNGASPAHGPRPAGGRGESVRNLITGGAGFVGSHLAEALLARGEEVIVVDNLSTGDRANIAHLLPDSYFQFYRGDIRDHALMEDLVRDADRVFHLAAAVGVKLIMERPVETVITNVRGTEIVLELCSRYRRKMLLASTSEVYGKALENGHAGGSNVLTETRDWTLGPTTLRRWAYACSKAMDEFLALAYRDEMELPVVVVRFFNTVGPRQTGRYGMVIPSFVRNALLGEPITVFGDGEQSRSFTHVADAIRAVIGLIDSPAAVGEVVNIGNGDEITINDLARKVKQMSGSDSPIRHVPYEEFYGPGFEDMRRRTPDLTKLKQLTDYQPRHDLDRILTDVIEFYRAELGLAQNRSRKAAVHASS